MSQAANKLIGYWMSDRKTQKLNWIEFATMCHKHGYQLIKVDLNKPLESQGPFVVFIHKLTDIIALANEGDLKSRAIICKVEEYISQNPTMAILDPLNNVRKLLDRSRSYSIVLESDLVQHGVFTPAFAELTTNDRQQAVAKLRAANVTYPFVCKPSVGHGSKLAHRMCIIFNEDSLDDCQPPCVAQSFINHNAVLYKVFVAGDRFHVVERPSLKNFRKSDRRTIFFISHEVSKADSRSSLSILDPEDGEFQPQKLDMGKVEHLVATIRRSLGMELFGVDFVVENGSGKYAIIDINAYPGYDGFPDFFGCLMRCIENAICSSKSSSLNNSDASIADQDSGFDTSDSSDEKPNSNHHPDIKQL